MEYNLYVNYDCISEHKSFNAAKKAFNREVKADPEAIIDILSADGEKSYLGYDPDTKEIYEGNYEIN